jgi:hypothetical protein
MSVSMDGSRRDLLSGKTPIVSIIFKAPMTQLFVAAGAVVKSTGMCTQAPEISVWRNQLAEEGVIGHRAIYHESPMRKIRTEISAPLKDERDELRISVSNFKNSGGVHFRRQLPLFV